MALFDVDIADASAGYLNIKAAQYPQEAAIKDELEALWSRYERYADTNFREEFARQPDRRFWEMYLTMRLLNVHRKMCPRDQLSAASRDTGPDICIRKRKRKIWIEAIAPDQGESENLDRVPDLFPASAEGPVQDERRRVELRITSALLKKRDSFERYRKDGIVAANDSCVVAISAGQFALQAAGGGLPPSVSAVYPFGPEYLTVNRAGDVVGHGYEYSAEIRRLDNVEEPIPRSAFQHEHFAGISGLIWSKRSIGNFLGQEDDFIYVHNHVAQKPIARAWMPWIEEYVPDQEGKNLVRMRHRERTG